MRRRIVEVRPSIATAGLVPEIQARVRQAQREEVERMRERNRRLQPTLRATIQDIIDTKENKNGQNPAQR